MKQVIQNKIEGATSMALATNGPHGLNLVPISVWEVHGEEIFMFDFFMAKTAENIKVDPTAAITCWRDFVGLQIKVNAVYETAGEEYDAAVIRMKERFPDRTLSGLIRLTPTAVYDVAPGANGINLLAEVE